MDFKAWDEAIRKGVWENLGNKKSRNFFHPSDRDLKKFIIFQGEISLGFFLKLMVFKIKINENFNFNECLKNFSLQPQS